MTKKKKRSRGKTASDPEAVDASSEPAKPPAAKRKSEGGYAERMEQAVVKSLEGYSRAMEVDSGYDEGGGGDGRMSAIDRRAGDFERCTERIAECASKARSKQYLLPQLLDALTWRGGFLLSTNRIIYYICLVQLQVLLEAFLRFPELFPASLGIPSAPLPRAKPVSLPPTASTGPSYIAP